MESSAKFLLFKTPDGRYRVQYVVYRNNRWEVENQIIGKNYIDLLESVEVLTGWGLFPINAKVPAENGTFYVTSEFEIKEAEAIPEREFERLIWYLKAY